MKANAALTGHRPKEFDEDRNVTRLIKTWEQVQKEIAGNPSD